MMKFRRTKECASFSGHPVDLFLTTVLQLARTTAERDLLLQQQQQQQRQLQQQNQRQQRRHKHRCHSVSCESDQSFYVAISNRNRKQKH